MAILKVVFPHERNGKFMSCPSYIEVPDSEVGKYLGVSPDFGVPLFVRETLDAVDPVKPPEDFFEEVHRVLEKNREEAIKADLAEDAAIAARAAEAAARVQVVEEPAPVVEEVALVAEEVAAEEASPEATEEAPKSRRSRRTAE